MQQLDLIGVPAPGTRIHRLFFALWPGDGLRQRIADTAARLQHEHAPDGRRIGAHRYHLTLQYLGDFDALPPSLVDQAQAAAATVDGRAFELLLDRAGSFRNASIPWWLGTDVMPEGLRELWEGLGVALARAGIRARSGRELVPHVTILRDARRALPITAVTPLPWAVESFVLIHSELGAHSAYTVLGQWPLRQA